MMEEKVLNKSEHFAQDRACASRLVE